MGTVVGVVLAFIAICLVLAGSRAETPAITRAAGRPHPLKGVPWVLILHPAIIFFGVCAYRGSMHMHGTGVPGLAAWGVLWPLAVEIASMGHPYRVTRLLRAYIDHTYFHLSYRDPQLFKRTMTPLLATERKLFLLIVPVVAAGIMLTALFAATF